MDSGRQTTKSVLNLQPYSTVEKQECRERLIKHAVECLTTGRKTSTCVQRHHVRKAWDAFEQSGEAHRSFKHEEVIQIKDEIEKWELFYDSQTQEKKPSDLRVCFLAGENPLNDIKVFVENGVLIQNICAIGKNSETIEKVWKGVMESRTIRKVRLFKGDFLGCMQETEGQFDIIYFGSTGPLPSENQGTLKAIGYVFLYNKLASPGALITTFSFPPKDTDEKERIDLSELATGYLKYRVKNIIGRPSLNLEELVESRSGKENYSDYITYQVIDTAYIYIPAITMHSSRSQNRNPLLDQMIKLKKCEPQRQSIPCRLWSSNLKKSEKNRSCKVWEEEVFPQRSPWQHEDLLISQTDIFPDDLSKMVYYLLCGQMAQPSYVVPDKLLRLNHTSGEGQMFSNVFIFDNCQYVFQQFPSVDYEFSEVQQQNFWVVQTIHKCLGNKLAFIYKDVFEYRESSTSDKPIETPKREGTRLSGIFIGSSDITKEENLGASRMFIASPFVPTRKGKGKREKACTESRREQEFEFHVNIEKCTANCGKNAVRDKIINILQYRFPQKGDKRKHHGHVKSQVQTFHDKPMETPKREGTRSYICQFDIKAEEIQIFMVIVMMIVPYLSCWLLHLQYR